MNASGVLIRENAINEFYASERTEKLDLDWRISHALRSLGIKTHLKGYNYLVQAIKLAYEDPESVAFITKILYIKIARANNITPTILERDIRSVIKSVQNTRYKYRIFVGNIKDHYTNKEFITYLAEYLKYE